MQFTKEDRSAGLILDPGWKLVQVKDLVMSESSKGTDGHVVDFLVLAPERYEGCVLKSFHYGAMGRGSLMRLLGAAMNVEIGLGTEYNEKAAIGEKLKIYSAPGVNDTNGKPINNITDFTSVNDSKAKIME